MLNDVRADEVDIYYNGQLFTVPLSSFRLAELPDGSLDQYHAIASDLSLGETPHVQICVSLLGGYMAQRLHMALRPGVAEDELALLAADRDTEWQDVLPPGLFPAAPPPQPVNDRGASPPGVPSRGDA